MLPFPLRSLSEAPPPRAFFLPVHPLVEWRIPEKQPGCDYSEPRKSACTALPQLDVCLFLPVGSASCFSVFLPFWGLTEAGSTQVSLGFSSTKA